MLPHYGEDIEERGYLLFHDAWLPEGEVEKQWTKRGGLIASSCSVMRNFLVRWV